MAKFDKPIVIIGGGPAGYSMALELRREIAEQEIIVIEKTKLGGTCLHSGCIPSKQLHAIKELKDFPRLLKRNQTLLEKGIEAELKAAAVTVVKADAVCEFGDELIVKAAGASYKASKVIVATGSRPRRIDPSLLPAATKIHDTDSFFSEENLAKGLAPAYTLIGGGYIGVELASMLASQGIRARIIEAQPSILGFLDSFIHAKLLEELAKQRIEIKTGVTDLKAIQLAEGEELIVAVGREPVYPQGYKAADGVYLLGDLSGEMALAHYAYAQAKLLAREIAGGQKESIARHLVPLVIFTKPEVASLGYSEEESKKLYKDVDNIIIPWTMSGKARIEGKERGYNKIIIERSTGKILGVHIIGAGASDLISIAVPIINQGCTVSDLRSWIFPHPTIGELFAL